MDFARLSTILVQNESQKQNPRRSLRPGFVLRPFRMCLLARGRRYRSGSLVTLSLRTGAFTRLPEIQWQRCDRSRETYLPFEYRTRYRPPPWYSCPRA